MRFCLEKAGDLCYNKRVMPIKAGLGLRPCGQPSAASVDGFAKMFVQVHMLLIYGSTVTAVLQKTIGKEVTRYEMSGVWISGKQGH